ncbi:hypothetical protein BDR26DRAFT_264442 [Obelidium mucronatum]|nr:hypothetical protein BDR26DRAFT_264442 [Obelidium mucronatum]
MASRDLSQTRQPRSASQTRRSSPSQPQGNRPLQTQPGQVQFDLQVPMIEYTRSSQDSQSSSVEFMERSSRTRLVPGGAAATTAAAGGTGGAEQYPEFNRRYLHDLKTPNAGKPRPRFVNTLIRLYTKYYRVLVICHFLFILFNCAILIPLTYVIHETELSSDLLIAYRSVLFTRYLTIVATVFYLWTLFVLAFDKLGALNAKLWRAVLGLKRRGLFWGSFVFVNMQQSILWVVVSVLFWDVNWICTSKGEGAELIPFGVSIDIIYLKKGFTSFFVGLKFHHMFILLQENCNELSSVWWYAIFNALAIYVNLILIVMEELKYLTDAREEVIDYYTKSEARSLNSQGGRAGMTSANIRAGY